MGEATVCKGERVEVYTLSRKRVWDVFPGTMGTDIRADTPRSWGWGVESLLFVLRRWWNAWVWSTEASRG